MPDNSPGVYVKDGVTYYRASELGHCIRRLWAWRSGLDPQPYPQKIQRAMDKGTELEPVILNLLYDEHGFNFADGGFQKEVLLPITDTIIIIGHVDQEGAPENKPALPIDVKAFSQSLVNDIRNKGIVSIPHYAWQQSVYALASGHKLFYMPIFNKDTGKLEEWSLKPMQAPYDELDMLKRIRSVEEAFANNDMPDCSNEYGCPFYYLHDTPLPTDIIPTSAIPLIRVRIAINNKITNYTTQRKKLDERIRDLLDVDQPYVLEGYSIKVIANPSRFNTDAAKSLLTEADIDWQNDDLFIIPGEGYHLRVTAPKKGKEQ
jgi:hypothetical protein